MRPFLIISERDNVATALEELESGRTLDVAGRALAVRERIPPGHKIALHAIQPGEAVVKYGSAIGTATAAIAAGEHVHVHNLASARGRGDLADAPTPAPDAPRLAEPSDPPGAPAMAGERPA